MKIIVLILMSLFATSALFAEEDPSQNSTQPSSEAIQQENNTNMADYPMLKVTPEQHNKVYRISQKKQCFYVQFISYSYAKAPVVQQFVCKLVSSGLFDFSTSVSC